MPQWCHKDWETCKPQGQECIGKYAVKRAFITGVKRIAANWCREDTEPDTRSQGVSSRQRAPQPGSCNKLDFYWKSCFSGHRFLGAQVVVDLNLKWPKRACHNMFFPNLGRSTCLINSFYGIIAAKKIWFCSSFCAEIAVQFAMIYLLCCGRIVGTENKI